MKSKNIRCYLCDSNNLKKIGEERGFEISLCKECTLVFVKNQPTKKELDKHYDSFFSEQENNQWNKFERRIFEKFLIELSKKKKEKISILDVGCGYGIFLELAQKKFPKSKIIGLEPYHEPVVIARKKGLKIIEAKLEEINKLNFDEKFDIITLWWVLEHLKDPKQVIFNLNKHLKQNGMIVIRVPNILFIRVMNKLKFIETFLSRLGLSLSKQTNPVSNKTSFFDILGAPYHLFGYDKKTLKIMFKDIGLTNIEFKMTGPIQTGNLARDIAEWILYLFSKIIFHISFKKIFLYHDLMVYARKE